MLEPNLPNHTDDDTTRVWLRIILNIFTGHACDMLLRERREPGERRQDRREHGGLALSELVTP